MENEFDVRSLKIYRNYLSFFFLLCAYMCVCVHLSTIYISLWALFRAPNAIIGILACAYIVCNHSSTVRTHNICQFNFFSLFLVILLSGWIYQTNSITWVCNVPETKYNKQKIKTKVTIRNSNNELISHRMYSFANRWFFFIRFHLLECLLAYFQKKKTTLIVFFLLLRYTVGWCRVTFLKKKNDILSNCCLICE